MAIDDRTKRGQCAICAAGGGVALASEGYGRHQDRRSVAISRAGSVLYCRCFHGCETLGSQSSVNLGLG
jgi:hypothetical protein